MEQVVDRMLSAFILVLTGLLVAHVVSGRYVPDAPVVEIRAVAAGADLGQIRLLLPGNTRSIELGRVLTECTVIVFFESSCPHCDAIGPAWAEKETVDLGGSEVPVRWVSVNPFDAGALAFMERFRLPGPHYHLADEEQRAAAGVSGWPTAYALDENGQLLAILPPTPTKLASERNGCRVSAAAGDGL